MKTGFLIIIFLIFFNSLLSSNFFIRLGGGAGYSASEHLDTGTGKKISYKFDIQSTFQISDRINIGFDFGYTHLLSAKFTNVTRTYDYFNLSFLADFRFLKSAKWLVFQAGIGPYFSTGSNKGDRLGIIFATGFDLPVSHRISIPILFRVDLIFGNPFITPINLITGLTFNY